MKSKRLVRIIVSVIYIAVFLLCLDKISDKALLKGLISRTGLTVIPGTQVLQSVAQAAEAAEKIGYPVMLKACAGGGG